VHEASLVVPLARHALERGRYEQAGALLRGFDKRWPGHADLPEVYLLGGRVLAEGARNEAGARRLFEHVLAAYPDSAAAAQARRFLRLAGSGPAAPPA
jgi:TolA-binding protein